MVSARRRGSATVELALGLLVFVTVLLFGIQFAEVGYLSLQVTEANFSALWHASAAKMHELPADFSPMQRLVAEDLPGRAATARHELTGRGRLVLTEASGLQVECEAGGPQFKPVSTTEGVFSNLGGLRCRARAKLEVLDVFPSRFLDSGAGALFREQHLRTREMTLCGVGRAQAGACAGELSILLDEWALATGDELDECNVLDGADCGNGPYYRSVRSVYRRHLPQMGAARELAEETVGGIPDNFDPARFSMSFRVFKEEGPDSSDSGSPTDWETTPGRGSPTTEYDQAYARRGKCFLGQKCPP